MKPVWSSRNTRCSFCGDPIPAKTKRIDTWLNKKGNFIRLHYHHEKEDGKKCFFDSLARWFESHPYEKPAPKGGRPKLDLTPEQKVLRQKWLSRLSALDNYYIPLLNTEIIQSGNFEALSHQDFRRIQNYYSKRQEFIQQLEPLGELPAKYQHLTPPEKVKDGLHPSLRVESTPKEDL